MACFDGIIRVVRVPDRFLKALNVPVIKEKCHFYHYYFSNFRVLFNSNSVETERGGGSKRKKTCTKEPSVVVFSQIQKVVKPSAAHLTKNKPINPFF